MIRNVVLTILVSAAVAISAVWAWSRAWEGVLGGWSIRVGSFVLAHEGRGFDLVLRVGELPDARWRPSRFAEFDGFGYSVGQGFARYWVPFCVPVVVFAIYPCFVFIRGWLRKSRILDRQLRGLCIVCGYDLTGLREPRCPECSAGIPATPVSNRIVTMLRLRDVVVLFVCLGIGYMMLSWSILLAIGLIASPFFGATDFISAFLDEFVLVAGYGGVVGLCWCSFGVPLLRRKPVSRVAGRLALVVGTVACATAPLVVLVPAIAGLVGTPTSTVALVVACLMLRRVTPDDPQSRSTDSRGSSPR